MEKLKHAIGLVLLFISTLVSGQSMPLDKTFGTSGIRLGNVSNTVANSIISMVLQKDGKILVTGNSELKTGYYKVFIIRYNDNGELDTTFSDDGLVFENFSTYDLVEQIVLQSNDKILIAANSYDEFGSNYLVRYKPDGSRDQSFGNNGKVTFDNSKLWYKINSIGLQNDGKLIAGGKLNDDFFFLERFDTLGKIDSDFNHNGKIMSKNSQAIFILIQNDNKIIVAGNYGGKTALLRFKSNGILDSTFGTNGISILESGVSPKTLASQSNGKIVVGCNWNNQFYLIRYKENGTVDSSFSKDGKAASNLDAGSCFLNSVSIDNSNKIFAGGRLLDKDGYNKFAFIAYDSIGTEDNKLKTITDITPKSNSEMFSIIVQPDGKILTAGKAGVNLALARYTKVTGSGINKIETTSVNVYPNPFAEEITVEYYLINEPEITLSLYDIGGKLIQQNIINIQYQGHQKFIFQLPENLPNGFYRINLLSQNGQLNIKVAKFN